MNSIPDLSTVVCAHCTTLHLKECNWCMWADFQFKNPQAWIDSSNLPPRILTRAEKATTINCLIYIVSSATWWIMACIFSSLMNNGLVLQLPHLNDALFLFVNRLAGGSIVVEHGVCRSCLFSVRGTSLTDWQSSPACVHAGCFAVYSALNECVFIDRWLIRVYVMGGFDLV